MLSTLRKEIDEIDEKLIHLLAKRIQIVKSVGEYKKEHGVEPLDMKRWESASKVRASIAKEHGVEEKLIKNIWEEIHQRALKLQN